MIPACHHFTIYGHTILKYVKFTLIQRLTKISKVSKDTLRLRLKWRDNLWIIKFKTLARKDLNQELNNA